MAYYIVSNRIHIKSNPLIEKLHIHTWGNNEILTFMPKICPGVVSSYNTTVYQFFWLNYHETHLLFLSTLITTYVLLPLFWALVLDNILALRLSQSTFYQFATLFTVIHCNSIVSTVQYYDVLFSRTMVSASLLLLIPLIPRIPFGYCCGGCFQDQWLRC